MVEMKKALTYDEQIKRLQIVHNLRIDDEESALRILEKVNYYRLSGYGVGLKKNDDEEKYRDEISLDYLYRLYCFDSDFKNILIHIIEKMEVRLRAEISNYFSLKYGAEGYTNVANFEDKETKNGDSVHALLLEGFKNECIRQKNVPYVKHHLEKYGGRFPFWVAIELFTFGNIASFFDIMKDEDRKAISKLYSTDPDKLKSWILSLVEIRNICAHYGRLYNMPLKQSPVLYKEFTKYRRKQSKVFPVILVIMRMSDEKEWWEPFKIQMGNVIGEYTDVINFGFMGFPANWKEVLNINDE